MAMDVSFWNSYFDKFWLPTEDFVSFTKNSTFIDTNLLRPDSVLTTRSVAVIAELKNQVYRSCWNHPDFIKLVVMMREWICYQLKMSKINASCYGYLVSLSPKQDGVVYPLKMTSDRKGSLLLY
jgi:hypothetical protein